MGNPKDRLSKDAAHLIQVPSLPVIDWEKYTSNLDLSNIALHRHMTRLKRQIVDETGGKNCPAEEIRCIFDDI